MAVRTTDKQARVTYDVGPIVLESLRSIDRGATNAHIEDQASQIENALARGGIARRGWVRGMLYQFRGLQGDVPSDYDLFVANLGIARASGALGPKAASAIRALADRSRPAKTKPKPAQRETKTEEQTEGMPQWSLRDALLGSLRAIERAPNRATVDVQHAFLKGKLEGTAIGDTLWYLLFNFMKVVRGEEAKAFDYFAGNMSDAHVAIGRGGKQRVMAYAQQVWSRHAFLIAGAGLSGAVPTPRKQPQNQVPKQVVPQKVPTPQLDEAIEATDRLAKLPLPSAVKAALDAVKSSLELARTTKQAGDGAAYSQYVLALTEAMFKMIGEIVKTAGHNVELAGQAAAQLGKIAKWVGRAAKVISAADNLMKIVFGKSLGGTAVSTGDRIDAAVDLIATFGGAVGLAAAISLAEFKWCWNHIGVPTKEALTAYGLRELFDGKQHAQIRSEIEALPTDPGNASATMDRLYRRTFKPIKSRFSQFVVSEQWHLFLARETTGDELVMKEINRGFQRKVKVGEDEILDLQRSRMAEKYKRLAIRFIDNIVAEATRWN